MTIPNETVEAVAKTASIKLDKTSETMYKGEKLKLKATANKNKVVWNSSNERVATVSKKGVVTAKKVGKVTITATLNGTNKKAKCSITVGNRVKKVSVDKNEVTLTKGERFTIKTTVLPSNTLNKSVTYKSNKPSVATVSSKGVITAKEPGNAVITVIAKDGSKKSATVAVTVEDSVVLVTKVEVDKTEVSLTEGETTKLTGSVLPNNATNKAVTYQSSNPSIATVDETGEVTAKNAGTCEITVLAQDGSEKKATVSILVESKTTIPPEENDTPDGVIRVTGVSVTPAEKTLEVGESFQLTPSVSPNNATDQSVTYRSENTQVVTVDQSGVIQAVGNGSANIIVTTNDQGKTAICKVTVKDKDVDTGDDTEEDKTTATVATQASLNDALDSDEVTNVIVQTEEAVTFTIPAKECREKTLVIDAPNAEMMNYGTFKNITIQAIAENTFYEYAAENTFDISTSKGRIIVSKDSKAEITVEQGSEEFDIKNDGIVSLIVEAQSKITIDGTSTIPVSVKVNAQNARIDTEQELAVVATEAFELLLRPGAENTEVEVDTQTSIPTIAGLGRLPIMISDTNELVVIVANQIDIAGMDTVTVKGNIVDDTNQPVDGTVISVIPYHSDITQENCESYLSSAVKTVRSDVAGMYEIENLVIGNYVMITKHPEYKTTYQVVTITSDMGNEFTNGLTYVVDVNQTKQGNIAGTVIDAKTGDPVADGIILRLRKGFDNLSGAPIKETVTQGQGAYQFSDLDAGAYTIQVYDRRGKDAYSTTSINVQVVSEKTTSSQIAISTLASPDQVRIVLTWGAQSPFVSKDLDSHLVGPRDNENANFHTWWRDRAYEVGGNLYVELDLDDVEYEGPETTTIYQPVDGIYRFYVHDFSNEGTMNNQQLKASDAKVQVYVGNRLRATYNVPQKIGTLWHVFDYDSTTGKLQAVNDVSYYEGETENIGFSDIDKANVQLLDAIENAQAFLEQQINDDNKMVIEQKIHEAKDALSTSVSNVEEKATKLNSFIEGIKSTLAIQSVEALNLEKYKVDEDVLSIYLTTGSLTELLINGSRVQLVKDSEYTYKTDIIDADGYSMRVNIDVFKNIEDYAIDEVLAKNLTKFEKEITDLGNELRVYAEYATLEDFSVNGVSYQFDLDDGITVDYLGTITLRNAEGEKCTVDVLFYPDFTNVSIDSVTATGLVRYEYFENSYTLDGYVLQVCADRSEISDLYINGQQCEIIRHQQNSSLNYASTEFTLENGFVVKVRIDLCQDQNDCIFQH